MNSCIDVSHKYGYERNSRKVILASLNPYRMDVYYNKNDSKYYLIGIKQSDVKFEAGKSVIDEEAYTRILQQEKCYRKDKAEQTWKNWAMNSDCHFIEIILFSMKRRRDFYREISVEDNAGSEKLY